MKTAMQELIDFYQNNTLEVILNTEIIRYKAIELLEKERFQIEKAFDIARNLPLNEAGRTNGSKFYKKTYGGKQ